MAKKPKAKIGRPSRSKAVAERRLSVRVTEEEYEQLKQAATKRGETVGEFIRTASLKAAAR